MKKQTKLKKELTFENVENNNFDLVFEIPKEVGERYEELTSFSRGRDFNKEVKEYISSFVERFKTYIKEDNNTALNERLVLYNKLVVDLKTKILQATTIPSVMISGGANYPTKRKEKEVARIHKLEAELYSTEGKHEKFLRNTRKYFDPVLIDQRAKTERIQKERADKRSWYEFYQELDHEEIAGFGIDLDYNRVYITTHGKPADEVRTLLKQAALKWSPKNMRWQRVLTDNAIYSLIRNVFTPLVLEVTKDDFTSVKKEPTSVAPEEGQ